MPAKRARSATLTRYGTPKRAKGSMPARYRATPSYVPGYNRLSRVKAPLPNALACAFVYHEVVALTLAGAETYAFWANGLYDPNATGTGHQPRGFDQLMTMYTFFTVQKSTCRAAFMPTLTGSTRPTICAVALRDVATPGSQLDYMESRTATHGFMAGGPAATVSTGQDPVVLYLKFDSKTFFTTNVNDSKDHAGTITGNPSSGAFFHVHNSDSFAAASHGSVDCSVTIRYEAILSEPLQPTSS